MSFHNNAPCFLIFIIVINSYSFFKFTIFILNAMVVCICYLLSMVVIAKLPVGNIPGMESGL